MPPKGTNLFWRIAPAVLLATSTISLSLGSPTAVEATGPSAITLTAPSPKGDNEWIGISAINHGGQHGAQWSPQVVLDRRRRSPLLLSSVNMRQTSPKVIELTVFVANTSRKPITAFSIGYQVYSGADEVSARFELSDGRSPVNPGKSDWDTIVQSVTRPISRINVSVDFVEFASGDTWGPDLGNSSQRLSGIRAGAREAKRYLLSILRSEGDKALLAAIGRGQLPLTVPEDHSPTWQESFSRGVTRVLWAIGERIRQGQADPEKVLTEPFDAFEENGFSGPHFSGR